MRARGALLTAGTIAAVMLSGCAEGATDRDGSSAPGPSDAAGLQGTLTIAAAASLGDALEQLAAGFAAEHPGVDVQPIVADGSAALAAQLRDGAPFDVLVSADRATMESVSELVGDPVPVLANTLVIVVPEANPGGVASIADLASVATVLCQPEVPCGSASLRLLELAGVEARPVSLEQSVRSVLTKVEENAVDAGLVYATDAARSDRVETIVPDRADEAVNVAVGATVVASGQQELARAFLAHVTGETGREVLAALGFQVP